MRWQVSWSAVALLALAGCGRERVSLGALPNTAKDGPESETGGQDGGPGGSGGQDGGDHFVSWDGGGPSCGVMTMPIPYSAKTPDVIISFDKSGSMSKAFGTGTRFTTERDLLKPLVAMFEDKVRWGFEEFPKNTASAVCPGGAACCADPVSVSPAFKNAAAIAAAIDGTGGSSSRVNTPTADALRYCSDFYATYDDDIKERYVLLSTDGLPNCATAGGDACREAVSAVTQLLADGVKTIVLGISDESFGACLEDMAKAGGAPRPGGPPSYFQAEDPAALMAALSSIIGVIAKPSCNVDLAWPPPDPSKVAVFFDGQQVPWDDKDADGWNYDPSSPTRLRIFGSWCAKLEGYQVKSIDVQFGCPPCGGTVPCS